MVPFFVQIKCELGRAYAVADALARAGRPELAPRLQMPLSPARMWALLQEG